MSSKPPRAGFLGAQYEPPTIYPLYPHFDLHSAAASSPPGLKHSIFTGKKAVDALYEAADRAPMEVSFAEKYKNWSVEPARSTPCSDLHSYSAVPLLRATSDHRLLCASAAAGHGGAIGGDIKEGTDHAIHGDFLGSSVGAGVNVGILPLSSSDTPFSEENYRSGTSKAQCCTLQADMEILRANERHNAVSGSVHLFQDIPSSLTQQNTDLSSASNYRLPYNCNLEQGTPFASSLSNRHHHSAQDFQLFSDHRHRWDPALQTSTGASNPHAELLLLPGTSESVVEAPHASVVPEAGLSSSSKLDLLHVSSLHDKQGSAMALPLRVMGEAGPSLPPSIPLWNTDKVGMAVGLGLQESPAERCTQLPLTDAEHHASMRLAAQSGLSLLLQSPLQRAHSTALALDAARYSARSGAGSVSVLRNSKYLKAAQQLLNECCNVCRDWNGRTGRSSDLPKRSTIETSYNNMQWSMMGRNHHECVTEGDVEDDDEQTSRLFSSVIGAEKSSHSLDLQQESCLKKEQLQKAMAVVDNQPVAKQLPADERCHLQMRKARLVAMVEELDRRYQQYIDQMQLIVTSFESAVGMGGAAPYTTLARKAMSRQFRGLRDAIGEHIRGVCRGLGEEVSSVPILSRGETPRLRLVDQRLRHQRSLQQMGMLQQQQAWRPQRGLPERAVSVLRAWLFEHFLHPYPKDSEKSMLARLTGLSRNQVSNWFINARVRLWKPMIEEMYIEERKALQEQGSEGIIGVEADEIGEQAEAANGGDPDGMNNMSSIQWMMAEAEEKQQAAQSQLGCVVPLRGQVLDEQCCPNDLQSFVQFHSSARGAGASPPSPDCQSHPFWWMMKLPAAAHVSDIGSIVRSGSSLLYNHSPHQMSSNSQASALIHNQQQQGPLLSASASNLYKNGVSLTLGLQQPPLHSPFNPNPTSATNPYHGRPSEALLF